MKIKGLNVQITSAVLSSILIGNTTFALATPIYAENIDDYGEENTDYGNENLDDLVFEEQEFIDSENTSETISEKSIKEKETVSVSAVSENNLDEAIQENALITDFKNESEMMPSLEETPITAKVAVVTSKVDVEGNPLVGATLQILDSQGNILDEWVSDGENHVSLIPVGNYILHEKAAPNGYITSADKEFTVQIDIDKMKAGVDHDDSHDVCWHYAGVALYYVESEGLKEEVYCINQNWEEPEGTFYDGMVLDETNIRSFTPDADSNMSDKELYNKVLDIIYHRSKVEDLFPELSETEIRFITEYALKTYTSAEVTTRQARRDQSGKLIRDENGNLIYDDIPFLRQYRYDPTSPKGYVVDPENGDGIGKLAEHWYNQHGKQPLPPEYAALFYYLTSEDDLHPEDMFLYIYSTKNVTEDGELYQNLLGVRWFDPYDEEYKTAITVINEKELVPTNEDTPEKPPVERTQQQIQNTNPKTGYYSHAFENSLLMLSSGLGLVGVAGIYRNSIKKEEKNKTKQK